jgi:hypothetical protein
MARELRSPLRLRRHHARESRDFAYLPHWHGSCIRVGEGMSGPEVNAMHDLDRMMYETAPHEEDAPRVGEWQQGESEQGEEEDFLGTLGSILGESQGEYQETPELTELHQMLGMPPHRSTADGSGAPGQNVGSPRHLQELELASELLEVTSEAELDRFLASLMRGTATAASKIAQSDTGRALGGVLRNAAKQALPTVAGAIGGRLGPGGAEWGRRAGAAAADLFGLELEGLSSEDREFELARAFIRFAQAACRNAAKAPSDAPAPAVVRAAVTSAARHHAPGLLPLITGGGRTGEATNGAGPPAPGGPAPPSGQATGPAGAAQSGRWIRRGNSIVLLGA